MTEDGKGPYPDMERVGLECLKAQTMEFDDIITCAGRLAWEKDRLFTCLQLSADE